MSREPKVPPSQVGVAAPIVANKHYAAASAFMPENLLREARRQKGLAEKPVPQVCVLDPDGDMVRRLRAAGRAQQVPTWACYHTDLHRLTEGGLELGVVGCAVGAPFAVLVAEQLFASGCRLLVSITSAERLAELRPPPYFVLIERALRDEGTSYHYQPPTEFSHAEPKLLEAMEGAFAHIRVPVERRATWTTDAPVRETQESVDAMTANCARVSTSSLVNSEATWVLTVLGETKSASAIALLVRPCATSASTSRSRGLSRPSCPIRVCAAGKE